MSTTLVRNGTVVTAADRYQADVYIDRGVITLIGQGLNLPADTVVDASGKLVMPGGIDVHTHLDMPFGGTNSADDFQTGTVAAAHGGTTTLIDFAIQNFGEGLYPAYEGWMKRAEGRAVVDYAFHMIVRELTDQVSGEMDKMVRHEGVTSFKLFMAYPGVFMVDDATIFRALLKTRENGGLICMHAENGGVIDTLVKEALRKGQTAPKYHALTRPTRAEGEATGRAIALAEMAGVPIYIVHLSCSDALEKVKQARDMGLPAYAETCPQYLFLSYDDYEKPGFEGAKYVMSPPLREKWNQEALWKGLVKNDLQVVSTDHCPFCMNEPPQKQAGKDDFSKIPNGAPGIETRLMLVWDGGVRTGKIDMHRFVEIVSTSPAKMFGLWPKKGTIAVGSDGDMVLFDPEKETTLSAKTHHMKVDYNPYEGRVVKGGPAVVLSRGEPPVQPRPGPRARGEAQLDDLQLRGSLGQHGPLHPHLHAGRGAHVHRDELVAGPHHDPPRQHHSPGADPAELAPRHQVRDPVPRVRASLLRHDRLQPAGPDAGPRGLRLVRHPVLDRRGGPAHPLRERDPPLGESPRPGLLRPHRHRVALLPALLGAQRPHHLRGHGRAPGGVELGGSLRARHGGGPPRLGGPGGQGAGPPARPAGEVPHPGRVPPRVHPVPDRDDRLLGHPLPEHARLHALRPKPARTDGGPGGRAAHHHVRLRRHGRPHHQRHRHHLRGVDLGPREARGPVHFAGGSGLRHVHRSGRHPVGEHRRQRGFPGQRLRERVSPPHQLQDGRAHHRAGGDPHAAMAAPGRRLGIHLQLAARLLRRSGLHRGRPHRGLLAGAAAEPPPGGPLSDPGRLHLSRGLEPAGGGGHRAG